MRKNLFAYTAPGFAPPFLSINAEDGIVEVIVRSPAKDDGSCGETAGIKLSPEQFEELMTSLQIYEQS
jgi:hypothetical protein